VRAKNEHIFVFVLREFQRKSMNVSKIMSFSAPQIVGTCSLSASTKDSLTFTWDSVKSATKYYLVGKVNETSPDTTVTVNDLTPGSYYVFTLLAVSSQELRSNEITCAASTSTLRFVLVLYFGNFRRVVPALNFLVFRPIVAAVNQ